MENETRTEETIIQVTLPLHTHFQYPDRNGRIYNQKSVMEALRKRSEESKKLGGIPVTFRDTTKTATFDVDMFEVIGNIDISDIDFDKRLVKININDTTRAKQFIDTFIKENNKDVSFGINCIAEVTHRSEDNVCLVDNIEKIISVDVVYDSPPEVNLKPGVVIYNEDENTYILITKEVEGKGWTGIVYKDTDRNITGSNEADKLLIEKIKNGEDFKPIDKIDNYRYAFSISLEELKTIYSEIQD